MEKYIDQELLEFIFRQERDRKVNMSESNDTDGGCGCVMIQWAREKGLKNPKAGFHRISHKNGDFWLEKSIYAFVPTKAWSEKEITYGEIQDFLNN